MDSKSVLIIEDNHDVANMVDVYLQQVGGLKTFVCHDGVTGLETAIRQRPDVIILDLQLPGLRGIDLCRSIRKNRTTADILIIMLTASSDEIDRVVGFEVGADDYVTKPFSLKELLLRVQALLRRSTAKPVGTILNYGPITVDMIKFEVRVSGVRVDLTKTEFRLLATLIEHTGTMLSREELLKTVWGSNYVGNIRSIDVHLARLRSKIGPMGKMIKGMRGFGYKLEHLPGE